jgi:hypothetical protein
MRSGNPSKFYCVSLIKGLLHSDSLSLVVECEDFSETNFKEEQQTFIHAWKTNFECETN